MTDWASRVSFGLAILPEPIRHGAHVRIVEPIQIKNRSGGHHGCRKVAVSVLLNIQLEFHEERTYEPHTLENVFLAQHKCRP